MAVEILKFLVIIFGISSIVVYILHRAQIPSIVGFLVAGVLIGPYGVGLIKDTDAIEILAEIGVILLLFTIGLEFSIARLARMKKAVLVGGGLQVTLTVALFAGLAYFVTRNARTSVFLGFLI